MGDQTESADAGHRYTEAHTAHYTTKDLHAALELYRALMVKYPDTPEAQYSRSQVKNIIDNVVPAKELLEAQLELALTHLAPSA